MGIMKKYKVSIFGESYTLISDESEEGLAVSAQHVDELMRNLAEKSGLSDTKRIAVLASLHIATKLKQVETELGNFVQKELELADWIDRELSSSAL